MHCILFVRWIHTICDNITDDIYRKLERDRSIIYVCKLCREEVDKIKKECRREVMISCLIADDLKTDPVEVEEIFSVTFLALFQIYRLLNSKA